MPTAAPSVTPADGLSPPPLHRHVVVGLGASAGGMQALQRFFEHLPAHTGMAFVVVTHLSPSHESHAAEILQRSTGMPVLQVDEPVTMAPDRVYVIPAGRGLTIADGLLQPQGDARVGGVNVNIDTFFRALAEAQRSAAVCVVLSGSGSDGAVGLQRVKELGGVTLAQSPADAQHDAMPRAAIATGQVDVVLPAAEMPAWLLRLARTNAEIRLPADVAPGLGAGVETGPEVKASEAALADIMALLRQRTRHDFRYYKRPTVLRRLERRMQVVAAHTLPAYLEYLQAHDEETAALLQDMLISVTNFFRDRDAFEALERGVLPGLVAGAGGDRPVRAWVVGCASGEEAYSLAMLLHEACDRAPAAVPPFQVFASDIDDRALGLARTGVYPGSIVADVSPSRLRSWFVPQDHHLRVAKSLRERVLYAHHNVLRDPPFSRLDLICCRNLLIYLDTSAQAAVLEQFRFALNPGGVLFLGSSETTESAPGRFVAMDKKHRIYRVRPRVPSQRSKPTLPVARSYGPVLADAGGPVVGRGPSWAELHQQVRIQHAPPSALVDPEGRILHLSDSLAPWLQAPEGLPSQQLLDHLQPRLRLAMRSALNRVTRGLAGPDPALSVSVDGDGNSGPVRLTVRPLRELSQGREVLLVTLQPIDGAAPLPHNAAAGTPAEQLVLQLEAENTRLQQQLQAVLEHSETSSEELMSSNEELQALNEELRSTAEELETSREELQSTNEELTTVNAELAQKVDETDRANDDLRNMINASDIAIVFVDAGLRVQRFTPRATALFNLIDSDIGRPLQHITHQLPTDRLVEDAQLAIATPQLIERELQLPDGRHLIGRVLPYRTGTDSVAGAVLCFVDVTLLRQAQEGHRHSAEQLRLAAESTQDFAIITTDDGGLITSWNRGAERLFGAGTAQMLGQPIALTFTDEDRAAGVPEEELQTARTLGRSEDERWQRRADGSVIYCSGVTTPLGEGRGFAKIARDLTGSVQSARANERQLSREQAGRREAEASMAAKEVFLAVMSHELKHPLNLIQLNADLLTRLPEVRAVPAAHRAARLIQQTVMGQARIVDDLLDLSRARTGKLTLERAPVNLVDTLRRITGALDPDAQAKGVRLVFEAGATQTLMVLFDPVRADQVVWNLLRNALKFTPEGGSVRALLSVEGSEARLTVTDTGCGIAAEDLDRVFDMFSQAGAAAIGHHGGLGIGLALVRELVQAHGGRVQVRSDGLDRGAEFSVWVPLCNDPAPAAAPASQPSVLQTLRVLVVDDSSDSVETQAALLALTGATVVAAHSSAEALACLDREHFDLLISDVSMPGMSGLELIAAVRARADGPQLLALACSGYGSIEDAKRAVDAGFDAMLPKPSSLTQIEQTVAAMIERRTG